MVGRRLVSMIRRERTSRRSLDRLQSQPGSTGGSTSAIALPSGPGTVTWRTPSIRLDRFMLDALASAVRREECVEPFDGQGDSIRARVCRVRLDEERGCALISQSTSSPARLSGGRPKNRVYQSMPASRLDAGTTGKDLSNSAH